MLAGPRWSLASLALVLTAAACTSYYEVTIETPVRARFDVGAFDRVLVAGFLAGGSDAVDSNLETTRLLRSQLRTRSKLRVIDADALPLLELAANGTNGGPRIEQISASGFRAADDFQPYTHIFSNAEFWQRIGQQHQQPLIVTGTILFTPHESSQIVLQQNEQTDQLGRRDSASVQELRPRRGFILRPDFIFIDGRTGAVLHSEVFEETILYPATNPTPPLSSYFELMDRLLPDFLSTFSSQKIPGTRVLLK